MPLIRRRQGSRRSTNTRSGVALLGCSVLTFSGLYGLGAPTSASPARHLPRSSVALAATSCVATGTSGVTGTSGLTGTTPSATTTAVAAATQDLVSQIHTLWLAGLHVAEIDPQPREGCVLVYLVQYSPQTANELMQALPEADRSSVEVVATSSSYQWEPAASVGASATATSANRYYDTAPFYGADAIWQSGQPIPNCTDGWDFYGKRSGTLFMLTAGHCVGGHGGYVYTNLSQHLSMGRISTNYYGTASADIASMTGLFAPGIVYGGGGAVLNITGEYTATKGSAVTIDGQRSGEVRDNTVTAANTYITYSNGYVIDPVDTTYKAGSTSCQGGDSGAPVLNITNSVKAAGILVAILVVNGVPDPSRCAFQPANALLSYINGTLATSQ